MTMVAKGPKKHSNGSNISLPTMDFLMKGHVLGVKRIVGTRYHGDQMCCHGNQKREFGGSIRNFKAKTMSIRVQCWFGKG